MSDPTWGIVATIKAPVEEILAFAAYHLEQGAHHLYLYIDNNNRDAMKALAGHPRITAIRTDRAYWFGDHEKRPGRHQLRQALNATHAYRRAAGVDWLVHIDVDEFLCGDGSIAEALKTVPDTADVARVRPAEALAVEDPDLDPRATYCKAWMRNDHGGRLETEMRLYPQFGGFFKGGFLSHRAGKIFVRTGIKGCRLRIHRAFVQTQAIENEVQLDQLALAHLHVTSYAQWRAHFDYRLERGSYRAELAPSRSPDRGGLTAHQFFQSLLEFEGEEALRAFFEEFCLATPKLLGQLREEGLLRVYHLDLDAARKRHFPEFSPPFSPPR